MSEQQGYGYTDDSPEQFSNMQFGLNDGVTFLKKFEFTPNGGKEGAEQEALDIVFDIDGKEVGYRQFPVTKAFDGDTEVTDPKHPAMQKAMRDFTSVIVHILSAFVSKEVIKTAMSVPIRSFQEYCTIAQKILPVDFNTVRLDIFLQWQWQITGENDKTYLRIPSNMKHGLWLCKSTAPAGSWKAQTSSNRNKALFYVTEQGQEHPFVRSDWFMKSNFAIQQKDDSSDIPPPPTTVTDTPNVQEKWDNATPGT